MNLQSKLEDRGVNFDLDLTQYDETEELLKRRLLSRLLATSSVMAAINDYRGAANQYDLPSDIYPMVIKMQERFSYLNDIEFVNTGRTDGIITVYRKDEDEEDAFFTFKIVHNFLNTADASTEQS